MKNLLPEYLQEMTALETVEFQAVKFTIGDFDFRFTDCEVAQLLDDGGGPELYESRAFTQVKGVYSSRSVVDSSSIKIDNMDDYLTQFFVGGVPQGSPIEVSRFWLIGAQSHGAYQPPTDPLLIFNGNIDAWSMQEGELSIKMKSEFSQWNQITLRIQSSSCPWKVFTGTECQYAGAETWCDRQYTRCVALGNIANFGGERWVPSIIDKIIWWGRTGSI
jgi:hypothetical protein